MSDISVRIAEKGGQNSKLGPIGEALLDLSSKKQAIVDAGGTISSSSDITPAWETWPDDEKASAEAIYASLAINIYDEHGAVTKVPSGKPGLVKQHVALKFVFEEEGELVVSIPHSAALGRAPRPLENREDYIPYLRRSAFAQAKNEFHRALRDDTDLTAGQISQVMYVFDKITAASLRPGQNPSQDRDTFHTQLGEYNMRQCL
ncbi:hypothetical protein LCL97_02400 [Seohaeicola saemankumensis]|nr:hypothetical protein [Seohaeicola saemankumensis]MCA0869666.1 hypothetical protein [Seohaeicola saemankumensis]